MIKINLLRALKESSVTSSGELDSPSLPSGGFFEKLFPRKKTVDDDFSAEDASQNPMGILVKIVAIFALAGGLYIHESINIPRLKRKLDEENQKLQVLTEYNNKAAIAVAEIKKQQEYKNLIERQIASLDGLSKIRLKYIKVLDLIQSNLPAKMWFTNLKSKENILEATGLAFSETEISQFLDVMGRSVYFSDVSMISSEDVAMKEGDRRKYKKFNINFVLEGTK